MDSEFTSFRPYPLWTPVDLDERNRKLAGGVRHMYDVSLGAVISGESKVSVEVHRDIVKGHIGGVKSEYFRVVKVLSKCGTGGQKHQLGDGLKYHIDLIDEVSDERTLRSSTVVDTYVISHDHVNNRICVLNTSESERITDVRNISRLGMAIAIFITNVPIISMDTVVFINSVDAEERVLVFQSIISTLNHMKKRDQCRVSNDTIIVKRVNGFGIVKFIHTDDTLGKLGSGTGLSRDMLSHHIAVSFGYFMCDVYRRWCHWYGEKHVELAKAIERSKRKPKHQFSRNKYADCLLRGINEFTNMYNSGVVSVEFMNKMGIDVCYGYESHNTVNMKIQELRPTVKFTIMQKTDLSIPKESSMKMFNDPHNVKGKSVDQLAAEIESKMG